LLLFHAFYGLPISALYVQLFVFNGDHGHGDANAAARKSGLLQRKPQSSNENAAANSVVDNSSLMLGLLFVREQFLPLHGGPRISGF
jgi:hypothetical protein